MKVPNCQNAEVPKSKIVDYLLSARHPEGGPKARFFSGWGFTIEAWRVLALALINQVNECDYINSEKGKYGTKYTVVASIESPKGTTTPVKTVWMIANDMRHPRLITAYPAF
ncbi:MAG: hypothetical protein JW781_09135 [Deltaproteobacteria bacterium]|nr:hypothetical protein [Candidatus Anaeroferrophillacea bacterium]